MIQLVITELEDWQNAPPPLKSGPVLRVVPPVKVKPLKRALVPTQTHRMEAVPFVEPGVAKPSITVFSGPLTLRTVTLLVIATRFDKKPPGAIVPPTK